MSFIDQALISIEAGSGGPGACSFRREKYIPFGGPDGGDGGDGGSVYFVVRSNLNTLVHFNQTKFFKAQNGSRGSGANKRGKNGDDLEIPVPAGTKVYDSQSGMLICDCLEDGQKILIAQGGFHGLGNARFKTSTNRAPRQTTPGYPGQIFSLRLELQLLADVGLVGLPNAGKSSTIRALSSAKPKVADYPFTTLVPHLGVVHYELGRDIVLADIPGLIEGAHQGTGLGNTFLRHIARTKLLVFVLDAQNASEISPLQQYNLLKNELDLSVYAEQVADLEKIVLINKIDYDDLLETHSGDISALQETVGIDRVFFASALNPKSLDSFKKSLYPFFYKD